MGQVYLGEAHTSAESSTDVGKDLLEIVRGFGTALVNAAKSFVSMVPGVNLMDDGTEEEDTALSTALRRNFSALSAVSLVVFASLYVPCVATLGAIRQEYGTKWVVFSAGYQSALAWIVSFVVYQGGQLLGWG